MTVRSTSQLMQDNKDTARALNGELLNSADHALQMTRDLAGSALEKASERVRDIRFSAKDLASKGLDVASDATARAQKELGRYANATGRYVADKPVQSVLIAVAAGAVIAGLVMAARRQRNGQY